MLTTTSEIERVLRLGDNTWKPWPKQEKFITLPFSIREGMFGGSAGPGKTDTLALLHLLYGWHEHHSFKGIYLRRTHPQLTLEAIPRMRKYYPSTGGTYNDKDKQWKWSSGAIIQLGHCEHEEDIRRYDTAEYNLIMFDELTSFLEFQYLYLVFTRGRSASGDLPAIARSATNPGNIGHEWVKERFVDPAPEGGKIIVDRKTKGKRIFIPALGTDNPTVLDRNPNYYAEMEVLPEAERRAKIYGDWNTFTGQVFREWRIEPYPDEPENAKHVHQPFDIPSWWPRIAHIDWGRTASTDILWGAVSPSGKVIVYREYNETDKDISEWARDFVILSAGDNLKRVGLCHSAFAHRAERYTIAEQFERETGIPPISSGRDRIGGKNLVHEFLRWKPLPVIKRDVGDFDQETANWILRNKGLKDYKNYCESFKDPEPEKDLPRLIVFTTCQPLIKCIPSCVYAKKNPEDVEEFKGDDPYDDLRGLLKMVDDYVKESKTTHEELQALDKIVSAYNKTGDTTSYYMAMRSHEAKTSKSWGVRRKRRIR